MRRLVFLWISASLVAASFLAMPEAASAQEPTAEQIAGARSAYARGQQEFDAENFVAAEAAFMEAYRFVPNPIVLIGVAQARHRQGNLTGAVEAFRRYLTEAPEASDRSEWEARIADITSTPGTLRVSTNPPGATVRINGTEREQVTPLEAELPPGDHAVIITMEGHLEVREIVTLTYGESAEYEASLTSVDAAGNAGDPSLGVGGGVDVGDSGDGDSGDGEGVGSTELWVSSGVAGVALVTGTVFGFLALSEQSEFDETPSNDTADAGEQYALLADISFGIAAAAAVTGLVLHFTGGDEDEDTASQRPEGAHVEISPLLGPQGGGVSATLQF